MVLQSRLLLASPLLVFGLLGSAERRLEVIVSRWTSCAAFVSCLWLASSLFGWTQTVASPSGTSAPSNKTQESSSAELPAPALVRSIDLTPLGFRRISQLRGRDGAFHLTFDFFDQDRLLLTYEGSELVRRLRTCPRTHDDRIVHAVVINVKNGEVVQRADWYSHDIRQYLWPLASGKMLLRRGNSLIELDQNLAEKVVFENPDLYWASVTPDGKHIAAGVALEASKETDQAHSAKYEIRLLDADSTQVVGRIPLDRPIAQKITSNGTADVVLKSGWTWLVRFGSPQARRGITRVRSSCIPDLEISGEHTLLVGRCSVAQDRYLISSFATDGQFLWRHRWLQQLNNPVITRSAAGSRFALSSVTISRENNADASDNEEKTREVRHHKIEIFNAASGTAVAALETQPAISVGGNVAMSPDGTELAVLREDHLELYELAALSNEEAARFAAVRAGTPGLLPPQNSGDANEDAELSPDEDLSPLQPATVAAANNSASNGDNGTKPPPIAAAGDAKISSDEMVIHSRAEAVVVDVLVTDNKGHSVPGLKAEDFSVSEDGAAQKISYFKEHSVVDTYRVPAPEYKHPVNIFSNVSNTSQPDSATLILLDMLNTGAHDQNNAKEALTRYIKTKPANESFALCVLDGSLHLIRGFTADESELLLAMKSKGARPSNSAIPQLDNASLNFIRTVTQKLDSPSDTTRSFAIAMAGLERSIEDEQLSQNDMRTFMTVAAFEELARYMAGVPGRKKVLWLSGAFPLGVFASQDGLDAGPFHQQRNFVPLISKTMNLLASAHVSVYPIDIRGIDTNSVSDVATERPFSQSLPLSPLTSPSGTYQATSAGGTGFDANAAAATRNLANDHAVPADGFVERAQEDSSRRNSEHAAMDLVAEQTGGKAFYGSNDITKAMRTVVEQGSDYYTVSYTPTNRRYDGRFRKIRVRVSGRNYRLAHRSGYFAEDPNRPAEKSAALLRSLSFAGMMHGAPESRQIPFEARVVPIGEPKTVAAAEVGIHDSSRNGPKTIRLQHYSVDYAIPAGSLRFDPNAAGDFHGSFRLLANSYDNNGKGLLQAASTAETDLKPDRYRTVLAEGFRIRQELDIPVDASFLRLGVADLLSTNVGTVELPLPVPVTKEDIASRKGRGLPPVEPE